MIRHLRIQRQPDKPLERQPIQECFFELLVGQAVKRLQQQGLEHRQRRIGRPAKACLLANPRQKLLEAIPLHQTRKPLQTTSTALRHQRIHKTELPRPSNRHRILSKPLQNK